MRRDEKKRATRQRISDVASRLFVKRGFDAVTLDDVAVAAKVSKMTVFNYFARKEDLMLDREDDLQLLPFREALRARPKGQPPRIALRNLLAELREQKHAFVRVHPQTLAWWNTVHASTSLTARLRERVDEAAEGLAIALDGTEPGGVARLTAAMIVTTIRIAREESMRVLERGGSVKKATETLRVLLDTGFAALGDLSA